MTDLTDEITVKPEILFLERVLGELASGMLRVPKFQRPFVWRPDQMLELFDSIERGYPIGSLLVWDTNNQDLPFLERVAGIEIPSAPQRGQVSYLLDGHQRLSTLLGSLSRQQDAKPGVGQQEWMWNIYRLLGSGQGESGSRFRHRKKADELPAEYLPMRAVLRTVDFLAYGRRLALSGAEDLNSLIDEAEQVAQRIKEYKIPVIRLVGGGLDHAVGVYSRLNSSGQSMTPEQMVSALTYQADGSDILLDRIEHAQESLAGVGYGTIPSTTIFRSILAVMGEDDVKRTRWDMLARRVTGKIADAMDETDRALRCAVEFLRAEVGVPLARLIPYNDQVMLLVAFFSLRAEPSRQQKETLVRWFWSTSWSGFFAGANTTQIKRALQEMRNFAKGDGELNLNGQVARPFPSRFDLRSARIRAFVLWDLQQFSARKNLAGEDIDGVELLARSDTAAYRHVITTKGLSNISSPGNRLIFPTRSGVSLRRALVDLPLDQEAILKGHGIPHQALSCLRDGDEEGFIKERAAYLANRERIFIEGMGVEPSSEIFGEADIDADVVFSESRE